MACVHRFSKVSPFYEIIPRTSVVLPEWLKETYLNRLRQMVSGKEMNFLTSNAVSSTHTESKQDKNKYSHFLRHFPSFDNA